MANDAFAGALRPLEPDVPRTDAALRALREELAENEAMTRAVSHELRSPIGAMLIFSTLLEKEHGSKLDAQGRDLLTHLTDCARNTVDLMDRLLLFSRISQQPMTPVRLDMRAELRSVFAELPRPASGAPPALTLLDLPDMVADRELMRLLFANLFENAIKCCAGVAEPRIDVGGEVGATEVSWFVRDNGVGFDQRQAARLFDLFERIHSQVDFPGAGIGLAIVRRIARRHGGRVWADAAPGAGATFHVALPRLPTQVVSATRPAE